MYTTAIFIAVITGIIEALKRALKLDERFLPLISMAIGIGVAFLGQGSFDMSILETILFGIMLGLSASGLLSSFSSIAYVTRRIGETATRTK